MTRFSEDHQPNRRGSKHTKCKNGHPMDEGHSNVRLRSDGKRVCRACESARRSKRYQDERRFKQGVQMPFTFANIYYEPEVYANTPVPVLAKFMDWQKAVLAKIQSLEGDSITADGVVMDKALAIQILEREIPVLEAHIIRRAVSEVTKP